MADDGKNYTLGRGELWFAPYLEGTQTPGGERYFGNTPEVSANVSDQSLDHYDSDHGIKELDDSISLQTDRTLTFSTDNINPANQSLFWFGSSTALTTAAATIDAELIGAVEPGLTYQLGLTSANPGGARLLDIYAAEEAGPPIVPAKKIVVTDDDEVEPTTFIEDTDYAIDMERGRLLIILGGGIEKGTNLKVSYKVKESTRSRIVSGSSAIEGALRYISFNPAGPQFDWYMPRVKIKPNGDFALKGDDWQVIQFTVSVLKKAGMEALYVDGQATPFPVAP